MAPCVTKLVVPLLLALCLVRGTAGLACYINHSTTLKSWGPKDTTMVAAFELPASESSEWGVALLTSK
jgi:hypothetical protein